MSKKKEETTQIEFPEKYRIIAADLSLKRPGMALLSVSGNGETKVKVKKLLSVDNKTNKKKSHGELLEDIRNNFIQWAFPMDEVDFFVREKGIMRQGTPAERNLSKVEGLMDWITYKMAGKEWYDIYPVTIKKLVTGSGKAEKDEVAKALEKYVGKQEYKCDDESDAVAVGIAWLIQQGQLKEKTNG